MVPVGRFAFDDSTTLVKYAVSRKIVLMDGNKIEIPYDTRAEYMLTRVTLMRLGVPTRVLDVHLPVDAD